MDATLLHTNEHIVDFYGTFFRGRHSPLQKSQSIS